MHMLAMARSSTEQYPVVAVGCGIAVEEEAQQDGEGGGLGGGGHEADDGCGCSLVDVRCPDMEGCGGYLEA